MFICSKGSTMPFWLASRLMLDRPPDRLEDALRLLMPPRPLVLPRFLVLVRIDL